MTNSFIANINALAAKIDTIKEVNDIFDEGVIPILEEIAALDIQEVTVDLKKGNYLGNRKIDIALSLNNASTTTSVSYSGVTILLTSGVSLAMPFLNGEGNPLELTSHADIKNYIANHALYAQVLSTELTVEESVGTAPTLIRFRDADGGSSNVERVELSVYLGDAINLRPTYFWAQTTSSLQTIANRVGDIIALGNDIDSIVQLSSEIDSMLDLQNNLSELNTLHANLAEILLIDDKTAQVLGYKADAEASALSASQNAGLAEGYKNTAQSAATTATQRADEIKAITAEALTGTAGAPANVAYNASTGKFSFYIPQGIKGDKGDAFTVNATGTFAQRVNYNTQPTGFSFLATDTSMIYFKNSATSGDWSAGSVFGKGDKGDTGDDGRSVLSITRTAGTGASGTTDTYTITYSDTSTSTFQVYNGIDSAVTSVNGRVGIITLSKTDVGLTNVNNTSDANKPVSTAMQTQLDTKANNNKSINIGTTAMTLDRASVSQSLTGVSIDGNAETATKLQIARTINGVSFDGSASINIEDRLGTAIASAATTTLGSSSSGDTIHITGTTAIISFGASVTGVKKTLIFDGALTLTHNGTSLILPASANIVTAAGDSADFVCENGASGYWRCLSYTPFAISVAEMGYLDGVTSAIQTQINGKAAINANTTGSSGSCTGNAATAYGLAVHAGRNNEANKVVRTDANGYLQTGYIDCSSGNEKNASNPTYVWGTNGSDNYLRTYNTSYLSVNYATTAGYANALNSANSYTVAGLTVGNGGASSINMQDTDEGARTIHCNSHNIGFLTQAGGWGAWCDDSGNWIAAGNISAYSDATLKENVVTIDNALTKTLGLRGVYYNKIADTSKSRKLGVIAQEVQTIIPEVVIEDNDGILSVDYSNIVALLIEAVKEQQKQIDELMALVKGA